MNRQLLIHLILLPAALLVCESARAKVTLPSVFSDHMVLQQRAEVSFWGWTDSGKTVTVRTGWDGRKLSAAPDGNGKWMLRLSTPGAGNTAYEIRVSDGGDEVTIRDVLIGEVWFCSGQSNMEMPLKGYTSQPTDGGTDAIISAKPSRPIRICTVKRQFSTTPMDRTEGSWDTNNPAAVAATSATAYFFADYLQAYLDIPVGIIVGCWSGSTIETWIDRETMEKGYSGEFDLSYLDRPWDPEGKIKGGNHRLPCLLYNGMVNPLVPFTFKGIIWYQGEANRDRPEQYLRLMQDYARMMREKFNNPDAPYYFVQIAPYNYENQPRGYKSGYLYEAQQKAAETIPNCAMACTVDIGLKGVVHPSDKRNVGKRLALLAMVRDYGLTAVSPYSPTFRQVEYADGKATVHFNVGKLGLSPLGVRLEGFEVSGPDKVFHPAEANVGTDRKTVVVWSRDVPDPVAVRYCWTNWARGSVFSNYGLPVAPFRTDDWKMDEVK